MHRWLISSGLALIAGTTGLPGCAKAPANGPSSYATATSGTTLSMRTIEQGVHSGITEDRELLIRDADAWKRFYEEHRPGDGAPPVDFDHEMVVAIVLARKTGGYAVRINLVSDKGSGLEIHYTESTPSPDAIVIQVLTQPYCFVAVPRQDGTPSFEHLTQSAS